MGGGVNRIKQHFGVWLCSQGRHLPTRRFPGAHPAPGPRTGPFPSASSSSSSSSPSRELSALPLSLPARAPAKALPDVTPTTAASFPSRQPPAPQPALPGPSLAPLDPSPASPVYFVKGLLSDMEALCAWGETHGHGATGWEVTPATPATKAFSWCRRHPWGFGVRNPPCGTRFSRCTGPALQN